MSDEAVLIGWYIEKSLSILNLEKPPFTHRPTPSTTNLPGGLSSRTGEEIKTGCPAMAIHRDRMLHDRTAAEFMIRSPLACDFALLLFRPLKLADDLGFAHAGVATDQQARHTFARWIGQQGIPAVCFNQSNALFACFGKSRTAFSLNPGLECTPRLRQGKSRTPSHVQLCRHFHPSST